MFQRSSGLISLPHNMYKYKNTRRNHFWYYIGNAVVNNQGFTQIFKMKLTSPSPPSPVLLWIDVLKCSPKGGWLTGEVAHCSPQWLIDSSPLVGGKGGFLLPSRFLRWLLAATYRTPLFQYGYSWCCQPSSRELHSSVTKPSIRRKNFSWKLMLWLGSFW